MNKKIILIILSFLFVVGATIIIGNFLSNVFHEMVIEQQSNHQTEPVKESYWRIYVECFSVLFVLITVPFILLASSANIHQKKWWKPILALEVAGLLLTLLTAPPDTMSKIIILVLWQLPVTVNLIVLRSIIRKKNNAN
jgi:MFS-type transporter involved in bile tolerance (Atg22 family)